MMYNILNDTTYNPNRSTIYVDFHRSAHEAFAYFANENITLIHETNGFYMEQTIKANIV